MASLRHFTLLASVLAAVLCGRRVHRRLAGPCFCGPHSGLAKLRRGVDNLLDSRGPRAVVPIAEKESRPFSLLRQIDGKTKWIVTFGQTGALIARRDLVSPFMIIGAILAAFLTSAIKRVINQQRPEGALFTDPGMPSSHALVATFLAVAWTLHLGVNVLTCILLVAAMSISVLRVVCGHHTIAQILVGAALGCAMARSWMHLFTTCVWPCKGVQTTIAVYTIYFAGSIAFVALQLFKRKIGPGVKK
eukprot:TRINITY_DN44463_c0_g1_i1.p1 TRINITY_DN44463_c0_g1~~TRINITY_DN44463_c0_g1_i1.p1  ORF type:complete len:247 (+),score=20.67 TRINITY_DN44463_c0_g1_i1:108-848(+)